MEKVDAAALDGAMWWPNAGRVIKVPEEGEAAVLFACWLEDSEEAAGLDAIGEPAGESSVEDSGEEEFFLSTGELDCCPE